ELVLVAVLAGRAISAIADTPRAARLRDEVVPLLDRGENDRALAAAEEALRADRSDPDVAGWAHELAGNAIRFRGDPGGALVRFRLSRTAFRAARDPYGEAIALKDEGIVLREMGELEAAHPPLDEALSIFRRLGARPEEGSALENIGMIYAAFGVP